MEFDPMSHIGETHGIYTIVDLLPDKDTYGHWIYKCECAKCGLKFMGLKRVEIKLKSLQPTFICRCAGKYTDWSQTPAPERD